MRQPLVIITLFYIYGIATADLFHYFPISTMTITVLVLITISGINRYRGKPLLVPILIMVTAISFGFSYTIYMERIPANDISNFASGEKMTITGTVSEPATHYSQRVVATLKSATIRKENHEVPASGMIRLTIYDPETELDYGNEIRFTGRLKNIRGFKNPCMFDYANYVSRKGIRAGASSGKKEAIIITGEAGNPIMKKIYRWREEIRLSIIHGLSFQSSAVLQAMIIGATGDLTPELRDKFTAAGVTHILSISGSHLGFVTFLAFFLTRCLFTHLPHSLFLRMTLYTTPSKISAIATIPPIIFYSVLSGGETATIRSLIMAIVFLLAILIERDDDPVCTLAMAALLVLIWDPQGLFDISFQLSYTAVLSMIITVSRYNDTGDGKVITKWHKVWQRKLMLLLLLTFSATVSTTPIVTHYFNQITWAGLLSNMIIIPYAGFTIVPIGLFTSCLGLILNVDVIPLAKFNEILLTLFLKMTDIFAGLPFSVIHTPSPDIIFIFFSYLLLISLFYLKQRWAKITLLISLFLIAVLIAGRMFSKPDKEMMRVTFLDVGQGDSAIIEFPGRKFMVVDGGGTFSDTFDIGRAVVAPYLWNKGIRSIDYMVLSHPQRDHVGGLIYLLDQFHVSEVWSNGITSPATYLFDRRIREKGIRHLKVNNNMEQKTIGGCSVQILNPPPDISGFQTENSRLINDLSVVMKITCNDNSILLTGDIEKEQIRKMDAGRTILRSNIIKVPHHGARGSVDSNFISYVRPDIAVISAGYQNSYHHPSAEAISLYKRAGTAIYRTDLDGAIIVKSSNGRNDVITYYDTLLKKVSSDRVTSILFSEFINIKKAIGGYCNGGL
ncbi:MAG: DNA internalization-related competence protein ComEC/Rec2 [Nitrospirae bacterium]|nr:DNA internalization-related competence protein ComEC/Rec2 [Nitrospirota bacterium]